MSFELVCAVAVGVVVAAVDVVVAVVDVAVWAAVVVEFSKASHALRRPAQFACKSATTEAEGNGA